MHSCGRVGTSRVALKSPIDVADAKAPLARPRACALFGRASWWALAQPPQRQCLAIDDLDLVNRLLFARPVPFAQTTHESPSARRELA